MFERSLIASRVQHASAAQRWTAAASITLQVAAAGLVVALPLFHQEVLELKGDPPRAYVRLTPPVIKEFNHSFAVVRKLPCDVPLGDHPSEYSMTEKYSRRLKPGGSNPFIDPSGCRVEANLQQAMFKAILAEQRKAGQQQ